jgi:hypothetical protein
MQRYSVSSFVQVRPRRGGDFLLAKNTTRTLAHAITTYNIFKVERFYPFHLIFFLWCYKGVKGSPLLTS